MIDFNQDMDWLGTLIDDVQMNGTTTVTLGQLGLLKRCGFALIAIQQMTDLAERYNVPLDEFCLKATGYLNTFLSESEKTL